jgi:phospholipase C
MAFTRRSVLKGISAGAAALAVGPRLGGCGDDGGETAPPAALTHIVVVCMENRSFDHFLGGRKLAGDPLGGDGLTADMQNPDADGVAVPVFPSSQFCVTDPPHEWEAAHAQWNEGAMDGFLRAYELGHPERTDREVMAYLTESQVPWTWALASGSVTCDRWFSSVLGPTWPNRFYLLSGQSGGLQHNITPAGGNDWPSVFHRLNDKGVGWAYYYSDLPVVPLWETLDGTGLYARLADFFDHAAAGALPPVTFIDPGFIINDDHPPHHLMLGQQFLASVYEALADSPQWPNILLVITYDEHGGFFDHVPPPMVADDRAAEGFAQLGVRVPTIVAGPWVKQGAVSSVTYDHSSVVRHICKMFDLPALGMRDATAADLDDCLDAARIAAADPAPPLALPPVIVDLSMIDDACFKRGPRYASYQPGELERLADTGYFGKLDHRREAPDVLRRIAWELERRGKGGITR